MNWSRPLYRADEHLRPAYLLHYLAFSASCTFVTFPYQLFVRGVDGKHILACLEWHMTQFRPVSFQA